MVSQHYLTKKSHLLFKIPCGDSNEADKTNYSALILELSKALRSNNLELSALVASSPEIASVAYDHEVLIASVDWIAVAANDYYGSSSGRTSYLVSLETDETSELKSFVSNRNISITLRPNTNP